MNGKGYPEKWEFLYQHLELAKKVREGLANGRDPFVELSAYDYLRLVDALEAGFAAEHKRITQ